MDNVKLNDLLLHKLLEDTSDIRNKIFGYLYLKKTTVEVTKILEDIDNDLHDIQKFIKDFIE